MAMLSRNEIIHMSVEQGLQLFNSHENTARKMAISSIQLQIESLVAHREALHQEFEEDLENLRKKYKESLEKTNKDIEVLSKKLLEYDATMS